MEIIARKRQHVVERKAHKSDSALLAEIKVMDAPRGFLAALQTMQKTGKPALIAEIKKASPSKGIIREDFAPAQLAQAYAAGGAACLSVLTDEPYFQGRDAYLEQARKVVSLPLLRKDFMVDPYQIVESRALGADCVLLIMAALENALAVELEAAAMELGMDVLVEVHDAEELQRALTHLRSPLLGINNRSLKTLKVDLAVAESLAKQLPPTMLGVCESGIESPADIRRMRQAGLHCFLVGESLMRQADVEAATRRLLGE